MSVGVKVTSRVKVKVRVKERVSVKVISKTLHNSHRSLGLGFGSGQGDTSQRPYKLYRNTVFPQRLASQSLLSPSLLDLPGREAGPSSESLVA